MPILMKQLPPQVPQKIKMRRCEICEEMGNLYYCGNSEQSKLLFCLTHYIEHVEGAHHGRALHGCVDLETAKHMALEERK